MQRHFINVFLIITFCAIPPAYATSLFATVLQKGTGDPVAQATVVVGDGLLYGNTNSAGQIRFEGFPLATEMRVLAPGYEAVVRNITEGDTTLEIFLVPQLVEGEGLTVVAERIPEKTSKFSMSADELAHAPGSQGDVIMALQSLPGMVTASDSGGQVYMRGSETSDNQVVVNRLPIGYLYHFGGLRSTINPSLISDLNLFLGGFPVEYGNTLGGAIDVQLRAPKKDRQHYDITLSSIEANILVEGPVGIAQSQDSYYFAARRSHLDLLFSPSEFNALGGNGKDNDQFIEVPSFYDLQGLYRRPIDQGEIDYYYFGAGDEVKIENRKGVTADPELAGTTTSSIKYSTVGMSWRQALAPNWRIDMPLAAYFAASSLSIGTDPTGHPYYANSQQKELLWKPQLTWQYSEAENVIIGADAELLDLPIDLYISRPPESRDDYFSLTDLEKYQVKDTIHARAFDPYIKQRKQWTPQLATIVGIRGSYLEASGGINLYDVSPRAAMEVQLTENDLFTASWGRYLQLPQGYQIVKGFGNPSLDYTEAEHRIVGIQHKFSDLWSVKVEGYYKPMDNLVVTLDSNPLGENYQNYGSGTAYGVDVYLKRENREGVMGWVSYSYAHTRRDDNDGNGEYLFNGDQPHTLSMVWAQPFRNGPFTWMKDWHDWSWGVKFQAHSGNPYTPLIGQHYEGTTPVAEWGEHNSARLPNYVRLDVRFEREWLRNRSTWKAFVDILNLTNHNNITGYEYGEDFTHKTTVSGMPFYPFFGMQVEF